MNGAAGGSTCTAGESGAAGGAAAPAINVESSDTVFVEYNINVATLNEGHVTSNEGDTNTEITTNLSDDDVDELQRR